MLKDSRSYEVQIIEALRSVNRALGGTYGTSSAIHKSDFNQYEVQLIDAIKGIGRTLSGKGLSVAGGGIADTSGFSAQLQDLSRRVTILENESFFRLVDGNVTLKSQYRNLWVPGWLAAGGIGTGGGGGGGSYTAGTGIDITNNVISLKTASTSSLGGVKVDGTTITINNGVISAVGGGGGGTVTGVKMNGTTYSPTNGIVNLGTVLTSFTETDPTVPSWAKAANPLLYVGTTQVQSSSAAQALTGILSVKNSTNNSLFEWDGDNNAWHFYGNLYTDGWVSAGGIGSGSSGGSVVTISNLLSSGTRIATITVNGTDYDILAPAGSSGTVTRIDLGSTQYNPVNGVVSLPAYPTTLPASDVYPWAKAATKPSYTLDEITDGTNRKLSDYLPLSGGTMTGNIVMSGASVVPSANNTCGLGTSSARFAGIYGVNADLSGDLSLSSSSHIDIGPVRIVYDSASDAIHITTNDATNHPTIGFYADGFVAAGGVGQTS